MIPHPGAARQNSAAELRAFDAVCQRLAGFGAGLSAERIEGFLTALAAGPRLPEPAEWLPLMCGDAFERTFADPADAQQAERALLLRLKVLGDQLDPQALMDEPQALRLDPLMSEWTDADRDRLVSEGVKLEEAALMQTGGLWAEGFFAALDAQPALWAAPADEESAEMLNVLLQQISVLLLPPHDPLMAGHVKLFYPRGEPTRDELLAEACGAVQDLRVFWVDRAPKPATRRVEATPGRNDACPCGSGKKFKKCHGGPGAGAGLDRL
ncbi:MAG: UPF0149 family protein [Rubrivivax sp.]|nr:UPF0149 family protein [Rubrivivax sp.]